MTTKNDIMKIVEFHTKKHGKDSQPIFEILTFEHPNKEFISNTGKHLGFPDTGASNTVGFYHTFDDAYESIINNAGDMHETCYDGAFLLCRFPGIYSSVITEHRMYFIYNRETMQYEQHEEPNIFRHIAY